MDLPRYHRLTAPYYRLEGSRCRGCGAVQFPPRAGGGGDGAMGGGDGTGARGTPAAACAGCAACGCRETEPYRFSGRGTVFSFAEVAQPPRGFAGPYLVALVELEEGVRVTAQLTDVDAAEVEIGMPVEMVTRRLQETEPQGYLVYGYKFRPLLERRAAS